MLRGGDESPRTEVLYNIVTMESDDGTDLGYMVGAIRQGDYKYMLNVNDCVQLKPPSNNDFDTPSCHLIGSSEKLFNLADDPYEETDLVDIEVDIAHQMKARLTDLQNAAASPEWAAIDDAAVEFWSANNDCIVPWVPGDVAEASESVADEEEEEKEENEEADVDSIRR